MREDGRNAAYSTRPFVERADGAFVAEGNIECWRGSLKDLGEAAGWAITSLGNPDNNNSARVTVRVTYSDGTQEEVQSLKNLY